MPTLYALVCGIDRYRDPVPALQGCVNDATAMAEYLRTGVLPEKLRLELIVLLDEQATRDNIVRHFEEHLSRAKTGDTALFFFAGHGGQEMAPASFAALEPDGQIETILCYDSRHDGVRDLADKELRYLLHRIGGADPETAPHIVVVQDNCHSGGAVRGEEAATEPEFVARTVQTVASPRPWNEFLFARDFPSPTGPASEPLDRVLPLGRVVQIAACLSNEYAWETTHRLPDGRTFKGGIFTRRLLETLRQLHGQVTYHELQGRIRGRIGGNGEAVQTPHLYVSTHPGDAFRTFLYGEGNERPTYCNVQWNNFLGWHLDIGAFHRVPSDPRVMPAQVTVRETVGHPKVYRAQTVSVEAGRSRIAFMGEEPPQDLTLVGEVQNLHRERLTVFFDGPVRQSGHLDRLVKNGGEALKALLDWLTAVGNETEARYVLRTDGASYYVTYPGDLRPLARQQGPIGEPAALRAIQQLAHIARWETVRSLSNPATRMRPLPPVLPECRPGPGAGEPLPIRDGTVSLETSRTTVQLRLRNISQQTLFVGALMMDMPFGASPNPVAGQVVRLEAGQSVHLDFGTGNPNLDLRVPRFIQEFQWPSYDFYLKVFLSTSMFDLATLQMPALPPPLLPGARDGDEEPSDNTTRGFAPSAAMPDWASYTLKVSVRLS